MKVAKRIGATGLMVIGGYHVADKVGLVDAAREQAGAAITAVGEAITPGSDAKDSGKKSGGEQEQPTISFTAKEGDTLWEYANRFYPNEDPRAVIDRLEGIPANEDGLQFGEQVTLPVSQEVAEQFQREQEQANQQAQGQ